MNIFISNKRARKGWNCYYNKSCFWFRTKKQAIAFALNMLDDGRFCFKARVLPA